MSALRSLCALIFVLAAPLLLHARQEADRPNVILVMTDDQGVGDFGVQGNRVFETPNLDRFAGQSGSMTRFYVSPVCSPTRACLMTGRYNYRTRVIDTWLGRSMMDPAEVTVAELLQQSGYTTGIFGKWHLGDCYPMRPNDQGFDESLIHRGGGLAQPSEPRENKRRYTDPILFRNGVQTQTKGFCTDVYFDAAIEFIESTRESRKPFFIYLPTNAPHGPYHDVPPKLLKHYQSKSMAPLMVGPPRLRRKQTAQEVDRLHRIAAMITNVDQNFGRLMDRLEALDLAKNTMVIFLVDNGPNTMRYVGKMRGMKSHVHEGGIRSPLWVRWPGRIKPKSSSPALSAHIDLLPTILEACGVPKPKHKLDGRSLLPALTDPNHQAPPRMIAIQSHRGDRPVRYHHFMIRDDRYKLLHASGFGKERFEGKPRFELYDLKKDPGEKKNIAAAEPKELARLKAAYDKWFDDVSSTRPDNYAPPRIIVGSAKEPETVLTRQDWRGGSWRPNANGHWELQVEKPGRYRCEVLFDGAKKAESLSVSFGAATGEAKVSAGADRQAVTLLVNETGPARLQASLSDGKQARGPYQVILRRVAD